jgi:DNA sulfur modification protein DndE
LTKKRTASASKIKLSKTTSERLIQLTNRLGFKNRYVVCRLALGRSLKEGKLAHSYQILDSDGQEFNRSTLTSELDMLFKALIVQVEQRKMTDEEYFSIYLKNHIERGIALLYRDYLKVNSPIEFLVSLALPHLET